MRDLVDDQAQYVAGFVAGYMEAVLEVRELLGADPPAASSPARDSRRRRWARVLWVLGVKA